MADLVMPSLGGGMTDGRLVEWLVEPGQEVRRGDVVAVVDTSKGAIEIEVFEDGVVEALIVKEGTRVPVGEPLARIRSEQAVAGERAAPSGGEREAPGGARERARPAAGRVSATPAARRRAEEIGIELATVAPSEASGVVVLADVERAAESRAEGGEVEPREWPEAEARAEAKREPGEVLEAVPPGAAKRETHPHKASPVARKVAEELGVDLGGVVGSGPGGLVTRRDVERAAEAATEPGEAEPAPARGAQIVAPARRPGAEAGPGPPAGAGVSEMRRAIGAAMARSKREIPHYYLGTSVDLGRALNWIAGRNAELSPADRILPGALLLKGVTRALQEVPELNGFWIDDDFRPGPGIHPGVAISLRGGGLVAPAIHDADRKSVEELSAALRDLVQRARGGALRGSELADPTITVSQLGDRGVETVFGIVTPPQVAFVGFGKIVERPWAENGLVGARPVVTATLSADHRVTDGHRGGLFLSALGELLVDPEDL